MTITALLLVLGTLAIWGTEFRNTDTVAQLGYLNSWTAAWFQAVTARTAGFNTVDQMELTLTAVVVTIILMFIGASPWWDRRRHQNHDAGAAGLLYPCGAAGQNNGGLFSAASACSRRVQGSGNHSGIALSGHAGRHPALFSQPNLNFIQILFEAVSAFGTVGLDLGVMATANAATQLILIGLMYTGRVGVLLLMSALLGDPRPSAIRYPEEELLVG